MPKRLERLFRLLDHLVEGRCNIRTLAVELEIGKRQVYRDIRELREIGFEIEINPLTGNYEIDSPVVMPRKRRDRP